MVLRDFDDRMVLRRGPGDFYIWEYVNPRTAEQPSAHRWADPPRNSAAEYVRDAIVLGTYCTVLAFGLTAAWWEAAIRREL